MAYSEQITNVHHKVLITPQSSADRPSLFAQHSSNSAVGEIALIAFENLQYFQEEHSEYYALVTSDNEKQKLKELLNQGIPLKAIFYIDTSPLEEKELKKSHSSCHSYKVLSHAPSFTNIATAFAMRFFKRGRSHTIFAPSCAQGANSHALEKLITQFIYGSSHLSKEHSSYSLASRPITTLSPLSAWTLKNEGKELFILLVYCSLLAYIGLKRLPRALGLPELI